MSTEPTPDQFINEVECFRITGLSRTSRWRLMERGQCPAKLRLSPGRTGWRLSEVQDWMSRRQPVNSKDGKAA